MSNTTVNIKRVVTDISNRITQWTALYEALTNSIQARSTEIDCSFKTENILNEGEETELALRKVTGITITDNGEGFDQKNFKAFCEYRTDNKIDLGCKGVGRFTYLKLFENVTIESEIEKENTVNSFTFDLNFGPESLKSEKRNIEKNKTTLKLDKPIDKYFSYFKKNEKQIELDLTSIKNKVLNHLIPILYLQKEKGINIKITFYDEKNDDEITIDREDIPKLQKKSFSILEYNFDLHYLINSNIKKNLFAFYCANSRTVCHFSEKDFQPKGFSGYLLLESEYLNQNIDNERDDFFIYPHRTDMYQTISWEMINNEIKKILPILVEKEISDFKSKNKEVIRKIFEERPYLIQYIDKNDLEIAGFIEEKGIIDNAKKEFDHAKESIIDTIKNEEFSDTDLENAIRVTQNELVSYVQDRVLVIKQLKTMLNSKEKQEKVIHNLFMKKYTESYEYDYFVDNRNNLWLLDDRFTNYTYAASDKRVTDVLSVLESDVETKIDNDKPDLSIFFSHDPNDPDGLKAVIIELKSFSDESKSDRKKFEGIQQLLDYIEAFRNANRIKEIWAFLVTDIDEKFSDRLIKNGFTPFFSTHRPIYSNYYPGINSFIQVVSAESLILDAEARNKVFIDIINKQSKLAELLG